jgi:D-alanine transaminase
MNKKISFLNGQFIDHEKCFVHIEDRGFQFADGIYEVVLFEQNKLIDFNPHIERLFRSLNEVNINHNFSKEYLEKIMLELFTLNKMEEGTCYLQITRGSANARIQNCPNNLQPTIFATIAERKKISQTDFEKGFSVITHEDIRWLRCDIKSIALLASTLINQKAKDAGFDDAIFIRNQIITEATFANVFIVDQENNLITKIADNQILCGITRNRIISLAKENKISVIEKNFSLAEMLKAKEVFLTSSSLIVRPVVKINEDQINQGKVGDLSRKILELYQNFVRNY